MWSRIFAMPYQGLPRTAFVYLPQWGCPGMIPLLVQNVVGLIQASTRCEGLDTMMSRLEDRAEELPMAEWWMGRLTPSWWDSTPLVWVLKQAQLGFPSLRGRTPYHSELRVVAQAVLELLSSQPGASTSQLHHAGARALGGDPLPELFRRNLLRWFPERALEIRGIRFEQVQQELALLPPSWCHCLVRLWTNCAVTASRFGLGLQPCRFGCGMGRDSVTHFLRCSVLWNRVWGYLKIAGPLPLLCRVGLHPCLNPPTRFAGPVLAMFWINSLKANSSKEGSFEKACNLFHSGRPTKGQLARFARARISVWRASEAQ